jgi:uncharacterized protein (DUF1697 family)
MNLKMPDLKRCFESAGFPSVRTLLSSGNVAFNSKGTVASPERRVEDTMSKQLGRTFYTIVRSVSDLRAMIEADPYEKHSLPREAKRVVTFIRNARKPKIPLPIESDGARILAIKGCEVFSAYVPDPVDPYLWV